MRRPLALILVLGVAGCYRQATPDPALLDRIATLEARVAAQDKQLAELRAQPQAGIEVAAVAARVEEINAKLTQLNAAGIGRPPAAPRRTFDPALTYAVPLGTSPVLGPPTAKVTIVMAFEFACRFCRRGWDTMDVLRKRYGRDLRVVYKQYVVHPKLATPAAYAACAAHKQGKWRAMADLLWTKAFDTSTFDQAHIDKLAVEAGLDAKRYAADVASSCPVETREDFDMLKRFAVSATPTFFINGRGIAGAKDEAGFAVLIDEELAKATLAIKAGIQPAKLYEQEVIGKGLAEVPMP